MAEEEQVEITVTFPSEQVKKEWIGQMTDGMGEHFCDFMPNHEDGTYKVRKVYEFY